MIITISGDAGSGKSTIAKELAKELNLKHYSLGDLLEKIALKRRLSLMEISKLAETDEGIDKEMDEYQAELGKKEDNFIMDSRLGFHFIPHSIKIFIGVSPEVGAKRVFHDRKKRKDEKENISFEKTLENIKKVRKSQMKRYKGYYKIDYLNEKNYDFVIDTTKLSIKEVKSRILEFVKQKV